MSYRLDHRDQQRLATILGFAVPALLVAALLAAGLRYLLGGNLYLMWLAAATVVTCAMFRLDKWQARQGGQRVPEISLHILTLSGGFAGSAIGMFGFRQRHKTHDPVFWGVLLVSAALHMLVIYLWLWP